MDTELQQPTREHALSSAAPRTLFEKIWQEHVVCEPPGQPPLLYVDLHLVHEVTSPQAFDGLRAAGRRVRQPQRTLVTVDHNVPTTPRASSHHRSHRGAPDGSAAP